MMPSDTIRCLLRLFVRTPTPVPWNVVDLETGGLIFVVDARNTASTLIMSAVASQFGEVVAMDSVAVDGDEVIGCLVRSVEKSREAAAMIRGAYHFAMRENEETDEEHPY
tara:strand:- start:16644 stop:16973 length:330 start_codon:yes stop_codon:yes gene_type:complete